MEAWREAAIQSSFILVIKILISARPILIKHTHNYTLYTYLI